jgi:hypothetical protein
MGIVYLSPLSIFVSLNKDKELEVGPKFMFLFCLLGGGGSENVTCLKRGATKKYYNCRVSAQSPPVQ